MLIGAIIGLFIGLLRLWIGILRLQHRINQQVKYGFARSGKITLSPASFIFPAMATLLGAIIGYFVA